MNNVEGNVGNFGSSGSSFASEFERLLNNDFNRFRPGSVVEGTVVQVGKDYVTVDIGFKSDGIVPIQQFSDAEGKYQVVLGDKVEVFILALENEDGQVSLSKEKAQQKKVWDSVEKIFKEKGLVHGVITHKVKGGLQVDIGIPAFLPGSQVDIKPHRNLDKFIGQNLDYRVLKITRDKGNIVVSRRAVLLNEREQLKTETLKVIGEGVIMEGTVKNITEYGAFVDLGGIDGLLHITDISWGRVNHPSERLSIGQIVPVVVVKYDSEKQRVSLGMKQLRKDPWLEVNGKYPVGTKVRGKVIGLTEYGCFVEVEEGVEGLVHISDMSWTKKVKNPSKLVTQGEMVEAQVLGIDAENRRISLGLKQLQVNPWEELKVKHPIRSRVTGKIRSITDFGVFVGVDDGIDGLVHVSDISWTKRIKDPKELQEMFKKGDEIEAVVLDIDADNERLSLGLKQLSTDPWDTIPQRYPVGSKIKGKITSHTDFGLFVELEDGIEGLIHNSQLGVEKGEDIVASYPAGSMIEAEVTNIDREERRISLSVRTIKKRREKEEMESFMQEDSEPLTFGDLLKQKLEGKD